MMTRFVLTLLVGLVVSLGALVSGGSGVALAGNWNLNKNASKNTSRPLASMTDQGVCASANPTANSSNYKDYQLEIRERGLNCQVLGLYWRGTSLSDETDLAVCRWANHVGNWHSEEYSAEAARRQLICKKITPNLRVSDKKLCNIIGNSSYGSYLMSEVRVTKEAKRRGLTCGINYKASPKKQTGYKVVSNEGVCNKATINGQWETKPQYLEYVREAKRRGLSCGVARATQSASVTANPDWKSAYVYKDFTKVTDSDLCWEYNYSKNSYFLEELKRRGLNCRRGVLVGSAQNKKSSVSETSTVSSSAALTAAEKEAERLRQRVAALEAEKANQQQTISSDTSLPTITIASVNTKGKQGIVKGRVIDNTGIAEVTVGGTVVSITSNGNFEYSTFVPSGGLSLKVKATDLAGLTSMMSVTLERNAGTATAAINFDRLNPMGKRVKTNKDALALIVGVADYENTPAKAVFADSDAMMFHDYASEKLGIPESRIKTLVNNGADEKGMLLAVKDWLARASKQGKSDVYVFFAGHGLASDNGEKMYLLPYDGSPRLLDDTAILRDRLFSDIASANPRSVTVFLDTCYSGTTRGTDMLIASRPIAIKALKQSVPDNFTVFTAAAGDQTAKPLEEAKHGMFSYFLMKGMEGEADQNQDNKITAGELHSYVKANVQQQSSGSQTPELQGDKNRVLVRFQ